MKTDQIVGRTYLERGEPVVVLQRGLWQKGEVRNVLVRRRDGTLVVRPFRGLRREKTGCQGASLRR